MMIKEPMLTIYSDETLASDQNEVGLQAAVTAVQTSGALSAPELAELTGKSLEDQLYTLGKFFDRSNIAVSADLKMKINAARESGGFIPRGR